MLEREKCACGSVSAHTLIRKDVVWCKRCGSIRIVLQGEWQIPQLQNTTEMPDTKPGVKRKSKRPPPI